jgi:TPR repeat protein
VTVNGFRFSKLQVTLGLMLMAVLNVSGQEAAAPPPNGHQPTVPELQQRAEAGDSEAQYQLALRYSSGHSVPHDGSEALKWFRKSAENGHAMGQVSLGLICREGNYGVKRDDAQAGDWFRKAADQGNAHGQSELGFMYERGEGVPQDDREAVKLYALAAAQGLAVAQFDLAYMYENGKGVVADPQKAVALYESAAVSIPTARYNLAVMNFSGTSIHKNLVLAYEWILLDVSAEHTRILTHDLDVTDEPRLGCALILAKDIAKHMSKDERKSGRSLAEEWIHSNAAQLGDEPRFFPGSIENLK